MLGLGGAVVVLHAVVDLVAGLVLLVARRGEANALLVRSLQICAAVAFVLLPSGRLLPSSRLSPL